MSVTAGIRFVCYSWYTFCLLQLVYVLSVTAGIRFVCYSWYTFCLLQLVYVLSVTAGIRFVCYSWYTFRLLQLVYVLSVTVGIRFVCYSWYTFCLLQLVYVSSATAGIRFVCYNWYKFCLLQLVYVSSATAGVRFVCYSWCTFCMLQLVYVSSATAGVRFVFYSWCTFCMLQLVYVSSATAGVRFVCYSWCTFCMLQLLYVLSVTAGIRFVCYSWYTLCLLQMLYVLSVTVGVRLYLHDEMEWCCTLSGWYRYSGCDPGRPVSGCRSRYMLCPGNQIQRVHHPGKKTTPQTLNQCCLNAGPASQTVDQHYASIGSRGRWVICNDNSKDSNYIAKKQYLQRQRAITVYFLGCIFFILYIFIGRLKVSFDVGLFVIIVCQLRLVIKVKIIFDILVIIVLSPRRQLFCHCCTAALHRTLLLCCLNSVFTIVICWSDYSLSGSWTRSRRHVSHRTHVCRVRYEGGDSLFSK